MGICSIRHLNLFSTELLMQFIHVLYTIWINLNTLNAFCYRMDSLKKKCQCAADMVEKKKANSISAVV